VTDLAALGAVAAILNDACQRRRRTLVDYRLDQTQQSAFTALQEGLVALSRSSAMWRVEPDSSSFASNRAHALAGTPQTASIKSNVPVPGIEAGFETLHFFPDQLLIRTGRVYAPISYADLKIETKTVDVLEKGPMPSDGTVVRKVWRHARRDGGPDRRFRDNSSTPIVRYAQVTLVAGEYRLGLLLSGIQQAEPFASAIRTVAHRFAARPVATRTAASSALVTAAVAQQPRILEPSIVCELNEVALPQATLTTSLTSMGVTLGAVGLQPRIELVPDDVFWVGCKDELGAKESPVVDTCPNVGPVKNLAVPGRPAKGFVPNPGGAMQAGTATIAGAGLAFGTGIAQPCSKLPGHNVISGGVVAGTSVNGVLAGSPAASSEPTRPSVSNVVRKMQTAATTAAASAEPIRVKSAGASNDGFALPPRPTSGQELQLLVRGYRITAGAEPTASGEEQDEQNDGSTRAVAEDLFRALRGSKNLAFANSRRDVEKYTDLLTRIGEREHQPNEFWAHHGNLSKELRGGVEAGLKDKSQPCTAVCTSTLELGIDIGSVKSIAQIGTPNSVASLRQRLGRSGRRGEPAILRVYIREMEIEPRSNIESCLHFELVQTIAMVNLLLGHKCEPPEDRRLHLSTLVQQILSAIAQHGGITAKHAWSILSTNFAVEQKMFIAVLRSLGERGVIRQEQDGVLLLDKGGERIVNHYSFYAAFTTPEEYRIVCGSKALGTLPIDRPLKENSAIVFAGCRWRVVGVDERRKVIEVRPAPGGRALAFIGERGDVHDMVRLEMRAVYLANTPFAYLDATARDLLGEARLHFAQYDLEARSVVPDGAETVIFTWMGDRVNDTVRLLLAHAGQSAQAEGPCVRVLASAADTLATLAQITSDPPVDPLLLAAEVKNKWSEKYDWVLEEPLLNAEFASRKLNVPAAYAVVRQLMESSANHSP
jgi:hypothetical protein